MKASCYYTFILRKLFESLYVLKRDYDNSNINHKYNKYSITGIRTF